MSQAIQRGIVILAVLLALTVGMCIFIWVQKTTVEKQYQTSEQQLAETKSKQLKAETDSKNLQQEVEKLHNDFNQQISDKDREREQLQSSFDEAKRKADELLAQIQQANQERDDWKNRIGNITKERDELMTKLESRPEKIVYKEKEVALDSPMTDTSSGNAQGDDYWAKILKQKAELTVQLEKAKADLDNAALQVADLRKQNSDIQMQIQDLNNNKAEIERRLTNERKSLEDGFNKERQDLLRKIKDGEDLASNLSMETTRARGDQKSINEYMSKVKDDNVQLQSEVRQLVSTKLALEKTVARLTQEKNEMGKKLADTAGIIQSRIDEIWQIKNTLDQKITQINQVKNVDKEVELPPIIVNGSGGGLSSTMESSNQNHKIISINEKNNFVIVDWGEAQGSSIGRILKVYRSGKEIATLDVIQVRRDISAADIKDQKANLQIGDQVR